MDSTYLLFDELYLKCFYGFVGGLINPISIVVFNSFNNGQQHLAKPSHPSWLLLTLTINLRAGGGRHLQVGANKYRESTQSKYYNCFNSRLFAGFVCLC